MAANSVKSVWIAPKLIRIAVTEARGNLVRSADGPNNGKS